MVTKMGSIFSNQKTGNKNNYIHDNLLHVTKKQKIESLVNKDVQNNENWVLIDSHIHDNHENERFIVNSFNKQDSQVLKKQKIESLVKNKGTSSLIGRINHYPDAQNYENECFIVKSPNDQDNHVLKRKKNGSLANYEGTSSLIGRINHYSNGQNQENEGFIDCVGENGGFFGNVASCKGHKLGFGCRSNRACRNDVLIDDLAPCGGRKLGLGGNLSSTNRDLEKYNLGGNKDMVEKTASFRDRKLGLSGTVGCSNGSSKRVLKNEGLLDGIGKNMVDELYLKYERMKKGALGTLRYFKDSKADSVTEVIDLDKESDNEGVVEVEESKRVLGTLLLNSDDDDVMELPMHKEFEDSYRAAFAPLTDEEEDEVSRAFSAFNQSEVLVTHENSNTDITRGVLQCLRPGGWLNDEVINVYFNLLKERELREPKMFLKCHFFHTLFYEKLIGGKSGYDFKSVKRWTTQTKLGYNLSECDKIFVPIHKQAHWCLAVINKKDQKFQYLDPLRGIDTEVLSILAIYYADELKDKIGVDIDVASWTQEHVKDIPVQQNGWDCGMFMIKYADFFSRGLGLRFNQEHMPYFRLRTTKEILKLEAK